MTQSTAQGPKQYKVLQHAFVMRLSADGRKTRRYKRGALVTPNPAFVDVERLVALQALGEKDARYPTPLGMAQAAAKYRQDTAIDLSDDGAIDSADDEAQAEADRLEAEEAAQAKADAEANAANSAAAKAEADAAAAAAAKSTAKK